MCTCTDLRRRAHRAAARIHDHLLRPNQPNLTAQLPQERWDEVRRIAERLRLVLAPQHDVARLWESYVRGRGRFQRRWQT